MEPFKNKQKIACGSFIRRVIHEPRFRHLSLPRCCCCLFETVQAIKH